jgi:hypothetical protein
MGPKRGGRDVSCMSLNKTYLVGSVDDREGAFKARQLLAVDVGLEVAALEITASA